MVSCRSVVNYIHFLKFRGRFRVTWSTFSVSFGSRKLTRKWTKWYTYLNFSWYLPNCGPGTILGSQMGQAAGCPPASSPHSNSLLLLPCSFKKVIGFQLTQLVLSHFLKWYQLYHDSQQTLPQNKALWNKVLCFARLGTWRLAGTITLNRQLFGSFGKTKSNFL